MDTPVGRRKRARPTPPLKCHIVDDHCDALSKIHTAIRKGALPFTGLSALHFDAHPDLMVTPDMPAETCFRPHDLYDTLARAEGGIAEWILPLVYQGHLSSLWWIRPRWARQFADGGHRFCVGQVKATGKLRVSSTAPYFIDDRLYCPEKDMQECKPLHLCVSLVPERVPSPAEPQAGAKLPANSVPSGSPRSKRPAGVEADASGRVESQVAAHENGSATEKTRGAHTVDTSGASPRETTSTAPQSEISGGDGKRPTPWVLDICLDYFTTENPFILEVEDHIGEQDAALVRRFHERPRFRGAATSLPHDTQLEHERIFKAEVDRLLRPGNSDEEDVGGTKRLAAETVEGAEAKIAAGDSATLASDDDADWPDGGSRRFPEEETDGDPVTSVVSEKASKREAVDEKSSRTREEEVCGVRRLAGLFNPDGEDRLLAGKFASLVGRIGREGREKVAWADHCACLPRYLATREEVERSVRAVEAFLRSLLLGVGAAATSGESGASWSGSPGVVTVARSEEDGYVPKDMVAFIEQEVLAMLFRLYGGNGVEGVAGSGGGVEVWYEDGLEPTKR